MGEILVAAAGMAAAMREQPSVGALLADELLCGECGQPLERRGDWVLVEARHRYHGWVQQEELCPVGEEWENAPKRVVTGGSVDLQQQPRVKSPPLATLLRGSLVRAAAPPRAGWQLVVLADGARGYISTLHLADYPLGGEMGEQALRESLCATACSYLGVCYRWGGKTPMGIDCSGFCSEVYLMHGIIIHRDSTLAPGFATRQIPKEQARRGDLLYFPGHIALYLGDGRYIHANATAAAVTCSSLRPAAPDYRRDLAESLTAWGSVF